MTPAGRPREFDMDVALDAAMEAFWHHGYGGTSMSDLERATGLGKGSLYKAFGDKHALFLQALDRYLTQHMGQAAPRCIGAATATEGVRLFMEWAQERGVCQDGTRMGCMAVNTVNELAQDDPEVRDVLQASMCQMLGMMTALVRRGQESGEFRADVDAESLAEYLATMSAGFATHGKGDFTRLGSADLVDIALSAIQTK
jgi:TetR/AcrR family transcriptional repressor of nem operon